MRILRVNTTSIHSTDLICYFADRLSQEERVILVDSQKADRRIPIHFGVENECIYDLYDYLLGRSDLYKTSIEVTESLSLVPGPFFEKGEVEPGVERLQDLIEEAKGEYEILLLLAEPYLLDIELEGAQELYIVPTHHPIEDSIDYLVWEYTDEKIEWEQVYESLPEPPPLVIGYLEEKALVNGQVSHQTWMEIYGNWRDEKSANPPNRGIFQRFLDLFRIGN